MECYRSDAGLPTLVGSHGRSYAGKCGQFAMLGRTPGEFSLSVKRNRADLGCVNPNYYIACDLGAESGREDVGLLETGRLQLEEIHRFPSAAVRVLGCSGGDVLRIFEELENRAAQGRPTQCDDFSSTGWTPGASTTCRSTRYILCYRRHSITATRARKRTTTECVRASVRKFNSAETGIQFMPISNHLPPCLGRGKKKRESAGVCGSLPTTATILTISFAGGSGKTRSNASTTQPEPAHPFLVGRAHRTVRFFP